MEDLRVARNWAREHVEAPGLIWAPIQEVLEPPSPWIVRLSQVCGVVAFLMLPGFAWERSVASQALQPEGMTGSTRSIAVTLRETVASPQMALGPAESGAGHVRGTDSIDPELVRAVLQQRLPGPAEPLAPGWEGTVPQGLGGSGLEGIDLTLPPAPGGTGWARGTARDAQRGGRKAESPAGKSAPDFRLVVVHTETVTLKPPYSAEEETIPVVVQISIGPDGVPIDAQPLSGPKGRYAEVIASALKWRFEPLAPHGLTAPFKVRITFHPQWIDKRK